MRRILVVIDMQNDFIDGALGMEEALSFVPAVREKIEACSKKHRQTMFEKLSCTNAEKEYSGKML